MSSLMQGFVVIPADIVVSGPRWLCSRGLPGRVEAEVALLDKALRQFGSWRTGTYYRIETGDIVVPVEWTGEGPGQQFHSDAFVRFTKHVERYSNARIAHLDEATEETNSHLRQSLDVLEGREPSALNKLVSAMANHGRPLEVRVGAAGTPVRLDVGKQVATGRLETGATVSVGLRLDEVLLSTRCGQRILLPATGLDPTLREGDHVRVDNLGPKMEIRCIRAKGAAALDHKREQEALGLAHSE